MPLPASLSDAVAEFAALLLPVACSGCGAADRAVCTDCARRFGRTVQTVVGGVPVVSAAPYDGAVARVLGAYKDGGRTDALPALSRALRGVLAEAATLHPAPPGALLVPVPSSARSLRRRGYAPVESIVHRAGLRAARRLRVARRVRDQGELGAADRASNVAGAFAVRGDVDGRVCIVVDDVVTTGATLREALRALTAAGADVPFAVTIAATPLRSADSRSPLP
ncbi:ComF family protein [Herbiconiux sp. L3-i23]|uniref:ComF family protein n=1 Tax=Herbiconiux sp. L3-i23 TaxID=2905871 RepID=UPI002054B5E1|nr:phosphoribosyltransferase family protein [Herbiconiux sp. L3-i23]BDI21692.1 hypothetical protein L3i23_04680 [Herbiconiux sp. L3-i23]